jgi:hypothetical protein
MTDKPRARTAKTRPSKSGREIRDLAQQKASGAIGQLGKLVKTATSESVKLAALKELLDRGYGKFPPAASANHEEDLMEVYRGLKRQLDAKLDRLARRRKL